MVYRKLFKSPTELRLRTAITGIEAQLLLMNSMYFPHEEVGSLPPEPVNKLMEHCQKKELMIIKYNVNAHHMI